jgi:hypothetical protein
MSRGKWKEIRFAKEKLAGKDKPRNRFLLGFL